MEDLWAFNDERVARAIFDSELPVVSAVGHEPDVTISDFVADVRAATPSNAAELVAPDQQDLRKMLLNVQNRMLAVMQKQLKLSRQQLAAISSKRVMQSPLGYVQDKRMLLDYSSTRLIAGQKSILDRKKQTLVRLSAKLDAMSPLRVLGRGYSVAMKQDGSVLHAAEDTAVGEMISVRLQKGSLMAQVQEIQEEKA